MRSLVDKIRDDIRYKLRIQSFDQIELGSKTLDRPWDDILIQLGNQLRIEFGNQISNQLSIEFGNQISNQLSMQSVFNRI